MGYERIRKHLNLNIDNVVEFYKNKILDQNCHIYKRGKNGYCEIDDIRITIITAHRIESIIQSIVI